MDRYGRRVRLPDGYRYAGAVIDLRHDQATLAYVSDAGDSLTVSVAAPGGRPPPPGAYAVLVAGRAYAVATEAYPYGRLTAADLKAVGDSIR